jgi:hypothetical protein
MELIEVMASSIPKHFRAICPHSLTATEDPCPNQSCIMRKVCDEIPRGLKGGCKNNACRLLHEKKSCETEVMGWGECKYHRIVGGKRWESKQQHYRAFTHRKDVGPEEWRIRGAVAALREAHAQGLYMGLDHE